MRINSSVYLSALAAVVLLTGSANSADGQSRSTGASIDVSKPGNDEKSPMLESLEAEMKAKRELRYAEKQYRDNLERAELLSTLGSEIQEAYKRKSLLDRDDLKKLDKLEKLTKSVRGAAGGEEDEIDFDKRPLDMPSAITELASTADKLNDIVKKTPKHVISAGAIDEANKLLELIRLVRGFSSRA